MKIIIYLSRDDIPVDIYDEVLFTVKEVELALKNKQELIYTTQTFCLSSFFYNLGYDMEIKSEGKTRVMSKLLNGEYEDVTRAIRPAQNWEKMLRASVFNIKADWLFEEE